MPRRRTKCEGEVHRESGRKWAVRWREGGRRRYRGGFESKVLADRVLARVRGKLALRRSGLPPDPGAAPTLGDAAEDFPRRRKLTHRAGTEDGYRWRKHLAPVFGRLRPAEVDAGRIQWVMAGRSIEELKELLGRHSVVVTERYAHLRPDLFPPEALSALRVDLMPGKDAPPARIGQPLASLAVSTPPNML